MASPFPPAKCVFEDAPNSAMAIHNCEGFHTHTHTAFEKSLSLLTSCEVREGLNFERKVDSRRDSQVTRVSTKVERDESLISKLMNLN